MIWKSLISTTVLARTILSKQSFRLHNFKMSTFALNPLLKEWQTPFGIPPFKEIKPESFEEAFDVALSDHLNEIKSIADSNTPPSFTETIEALDKAGGLLSRVQKVFYNLCSSCSSTELQSVQLKWAAPLAAHYSAIYTLPGLFNKIDTIYSQRTQLGLNSEQVRLVERLHLDFTRAGAKFDPPSQKRYTEIMQKLAELTTKFTQNIIADESDLFISLKKDDLSGLPDFLQQASRQAAIDRGNNEEYIITLSRSLVVPFLTFSDRRDLREKAWRMWTSRGELDSSRNNLAIAKEILILRAEQAKMHGYKSYADYATADTMAGSPNSVSELLERVWTPAKASADREREALMQYIKDASGDSSKIEPWDWRYYAEKVRNFKYNLDESELKPYFPLNRMCEAIFDCANQLFGLRFIQRHDVDLYHPDVNFYEVRETTEDGSDKLIAIFLHDNFARPHKQSGAWMSDYRSQSKNPASIFNLEKNTRVPSDTGDSSVPIIVNNNNFAKGAEGEPTLLSFDDAKTLFHEFGHGLHGMLSNVTYKRLAGTSVLKDFVELPSQLYEHWLSESVVLKKYARHYKTNEPIPEILLQKLVSARNFNLGFDTVEYTACALLDQSIHQIPANDLPALDISSFESKELDRLGMPSGIVLRHRPAHFSHLFSGSSYASAYYVYLWAEVLDADGFDAFKEKGDPFDKETANKARKYIYSSGNSIDPKEAFRIFRGRDPIVEPMLKKKGLL